MRKSSVLTRLGTSPIASSDYVKGDLRLDAEVTPYPSDNLIFISLPDTSVRVDVRAFEGSASTIGRHGNESGKYLAEFSGEYVGTTQRVQFESARSIDGGDDRHEFLSALEEAVNSARGW